MLCIQTKKLIKYSPAKKPIGPNTVRVKRLARTSVNPPTKIPLNIPGKYLFKSFSIFATATVDNIAGKKDEA